MIEPQDQTGAQAPMSVKGMETAQVDAKFLPGIIIFVHGVNSDGEWYDAAEQGLIKGLNARLGLDKALGGDAIMSPATYAKELFPDGKRDDTVTGRNFILEHGRSPVIRFRWGYKAAGKDGTAGSLNEVEEYGGRIYLNEMNAWGGGPFQNGTSALPYMWGLGLDDRVFWWLYANMFPVDGRDVYACPPRAYFAHAAHRLKELIKAIRAKQDDCPITVVCHSQGNMVTLAAALMGEREQALADTYVLCNPPYSLESLGMDKIVNEDNKSASGQFGSVTSAARKETFKNFLQVVKKRANTQPLDLINRYHGLMHPQTRQELFKLGPFPADPKVLPATGLDRDNRGRVFLYCNPHDQVIGVSPVQGIGWRGVSQSQLGEIGADGVFHQRVWATPGGNQATPFAVGDPDWTGKAYRYIDDNHNPTQFWNPLPPAMRFSLSLNPSQSVISKIVTVLTAPIFIVATRLFTLRINDDPKKDWAVPITAPVLREPVTPRSLRFGREAQFDQDKDLAKDSLAAPAGLGTSDTEAQLRYEQNAQLLRIAREKRTPGNMLPPDDQREALQRMMEQNPNATDHSTILTNPVHSEKVLAHDVAIGWVNPSRITTDDLLAFRQFANWMLLKEADTALLPAADQFVGYWAEGFYNGLQLQHTYSMEHMAANAPLIKDERERSLLGRIKG